MKLFNEINFFSVFLLFYMVVTTLDCFIDHENDILTIRIEFLYGNYHQNDMIVTLS